MVGQKADTSYRSRGVDRQLRPIGLKLDCLNPSRPGSWGDPWGADLLTQDPDVATQPLDALQGSHLGGASTEEVKRRTGAYVGTSSGQELRDHLKAARMRRVAHDGIPGSARRN
jgi:hypothetical protein